MAAWREDGGGVLIVGVQTRDKGKRAESRAFSSEFGRRFPDVSDDGVFIDLPRECGRQRPSALPWESFTTQSSLRRKAALVQHPQLSCMRSFDTDAELLGSCTSAGGAAGNPER